MKNLVALLALTLLLSACGFGSGPAEPAQTDSENPTEVTETVKLTDDVFIALSAEILCLPTNNPEASAEEIEVLAKGILDKASVSEEDFSVYQQTIEADPESKESISLKIVGKMNDFCTLIEGTEENSDDQAEVTEGSEEEVVAEEAEEIEQNPMEAAFAAEGATAEASDAGTETQEQTE